MLAHPPLLAISYRSPRKTTVANNNLNIAKLLQKSGIRKNEVIELIYRGFI